MNLEVVLAELRSERDALKTAVVNLEGLMRQGKPAADRRTDVSPDSRANGANGYHGNPAPEERS